jgi:hypothetical protein
MYSPNMNPSPMILDNLDGHLCPYARVYMYVNTYTIFTLEQYLDAKQVSD